MKATCDAEADVLCLVLRDEPLLDAVEEPNGVIVSCGEDREPMSVEFLNAAARSVATAGELSMTAQTETRRSAAPASGP